jgi:hypothetical protein
MLKVRIWEGSLGCDAERSLEAVRRAKKGGTVSVHEQGNVG